MDEQVVKMLLILPINNQVISILVRRVPLRGSREIPEIREPLVDVT